MIRLKSILEQSTDADKNKDSVIQTPLVLFVGDSYTKSRSSYAHRLIKNKAVDGRVVAWPNINIKQLVKLVKRYVSKKYSVISIMFGDIVKTKLPIAEFEIQLAELERVSRNYGAQLVIIQNPTKSYEQYAEYLDAISDMDADILISTNNVLSNSNTQITVANQWIDSAIDDLNIEVPNVDIKSDDQDQESETPSAAANFEITPSDSVQGNFSDSVVNQAYDLIIPFEGFTAIAKKDSDGYCRIGHGSSHITKEDGTVINIGKPDSGKTCAETYTYTITVDDAHRDLKRLIPHTFIPLVQRKIKEWGGDISKLNDATVAALVSVAYNYGHIPSELKAGIAASDMTAIGTALKTDFNNPKSNPKRRKKEGDYILNSLNSNDDNLWSKAKEYISNKFNKKGNAGATVQFSSKAQKDFSDNIINPNLIDDLRKAAESAGVTIKIGTAVTGHNTLTSSGKRSRHADGLAVDIIEVNGLNWNTKDHAIQIGAYEPLEAFTSELEKLGYALNNEYNMDKAILTFGFKAHNDHMHVSRKS